MSYAPFTGLGFALGTTQGQNPYQNQMQGLANCYTSAPQSLYWGSTVSTVCHSIASIYHAEPAKKYRQNAIKPLQAHGYLCWLDKLFHRLP